MTTIQDRLAEALNKVQAQRRALSEETKVEKASSAKTEDINIGMVKVSAKRAINDARLLRSLGHFGVEKVAMEEQDIFEHTLHSSGAGTIESPADISSATEVTQPAPGGENELKIVEHKKVDAVTGPGLDQGNMETLRSAPLTEGGQGPLQTMDLGDASPGDHNQDDVLSQPKTSQAKLEAILNGAEYLGTAEEAQAIRTATGIDSADAAVEFFKRSAAHWGMTNAEFLNLVEIGSAEKTQLLEKVAMMVEGSTMDDISVAKDVTEQIVKAKQELPTGSEVAEIANVGPKAANVAIKQVADLVAAVNGTVMAPGQAAAAAMDPMAMGAAPPPMGAAPGGEMAPPPPVPSPEPMPAAPAPPPAAPAAAAPAPAAAAPAPPPEEGMEVAASAKLTTKSALEDFLKSSADADLTSLEEPLNGTPGPGEETQEAGDGIDAPIVSARTDELTETDSTTATTQAILDSDDDSLDTAAEEVAEAGDNSAASYSARGNDDVVDGEGADVKSEGVEADAEKRSNATQELLATLFSR
jgi:hypothetical protein